MYIYILFKDLYCISKTIDIYLNKKQTKPHAAIFLMFKHCVICNENIMLFVMIMITDSGKALIRGDQILLADIKNIDQQRQSN